MTHAAPRLAKAAFLDRDGTLIFDPGYLADPAGIRILPGVPAALRRLRDAGYLLAIVSNQSGIARGLYTAADLDRVHRRLMALLAAEGVAFAAAQYCQHAPEDGCPCRKPAPGMLLAAAAELGADLAASAMVGDKLADVRAGLAAGCRRSILLAAQPPPDLPPGAEVCPDLPAAVARILAGD